MAKTCIWGAHLRPLRLLLYFHIHFFKTSRSLDNGLSSYNSPRAYRFQWQNPEDLGLVLSVESFSGRLHVPARPSLSCIPTIQHFLRSNHRHRLHHHHHQLPSQSMIMFVTPHWSKKWLQPLKSKLAFEGTSYVYSNYVFLFSTLN